MVHCIDNIDKKILKIIQEDGRMSNKEIAAEIGLVPSAASERVKKLKDNGYIKKYEVRLDAAKLDNELLAFVFVKTNEIASGSICGYELAKIPEVQEVYNVAGEDCYFLKVRTKNPKTLSKILKQKIGGVENVESTRTTIVMESYKESCSIPIECED